MFPCLGNLPTHSRLRAFSHQTQSLYIYSTLYCHAWIQYSLAIIYFNYPSYAIIVLLACFKPRERLKEWHVVEDPTASTAGLHPSRSFSPSTRPPFYSRQSTALDGWCRWLARFMESGPQAASGIVEGSPKRDPGHRLMGPGLYHIVLTTRFNEEDDQKLI